jgi:hypothetical protein
MDYRRTWAEFAAWFPDDAACVAYLERLRWGEGFVCPSCGLLHSWAARRGLGSRVCAGCGRRVSVTAGTVFAGTRSPLSQWFAAAWQACSTKNGASALGLQILLGLGSYETAWAWLHKLRWAMVIPGRDLLSGEVEVDETYVGGEEPGTHGGRAGSKKGQVAIAVECRGRGSGRVRQWPALLPAASPSRPDSAPPLQRTHQRPQAPTLRPRPPLHGPDPRCERCLTARLRQGHRGQLGLRYSPTPGRATEVSKASATCTGRFQSEPD